jgi:hypothetical protein
MQILSPAGRNHWARNAVVITGDNQIVFQPSGYKGDPFVARWGYYHDSELWRAINALRQSEGVEVKFSPFPGQLRGDGIPD